MKGLTLSQKEQARIQVLNKVLEKRLEVGDWDVLVRHDNTLMAGRVCALKKSEAAAEKARRKALRENSRKGHKVRPETIEAAGYVFVFTTLYMSFSYFH